MPFAERAMSMVVSLYQKTSNWQEVIEASVLKNIIQVSNANVTYEMIEWDLWKLAKETDSVCEKQKLKGCVKKTQAMVFERENWDVIELESHACKVRTMWEAVWSWSNINK